MIKFKLLSNSILLTILNCLVALLIPSITYGAGWNINPLRIDLSNSRKTAVITVTNNLDQPTTIQIQPISWSQVDGLDVYISTKDLLISPPIVTIAPKGAQIIRVALRKSIDPVQELSYRINLQEIQPSLSTNETSVQIGLRVGIPVFVQPQSGASSPKLSWKVTATADNLVKLDLRNEGKVHVKISDLQLFSIGNEQTLANDSGSSYILAGQFHSWLLKPENSIVITPGHLHLKAYTDATTVDTVIVVDKP